TLLRAVVGIQAQVRGQLEVLGLPAGSGALRSQIGYMPQTPSLYADVSVRENLRYFAAARRLPRPGRGTEADRVLEAVDLAGQARVRVDRLSGGQRSRVSLAVALLGRPALLVLDEPTVGLDPLLRLKLWEQFAAFARQGTTVLVSSHVMDEADRCDRLLLLRGGRLLAAGRRDELLARTGTARVEEAFVALVRSPQRVPPPPGQAQ
ncbi:ABC transporter ATP-binding protein, partial [Streptomyces sp. NPDC059003]|uniref:ABC transporter ATP-binding protein n=1 Tax=Streptomyces sp. NPDC059003 TaxID=3346691 RepID=UPI00369878F2